MATAKESISGTLTWEEFLTAAKEFVGLSNQLYDGWMVKCIKDPPEHDSFYIEKKTIVPTSKTTEDNSLTIPYEEIFEIDDSTLQQIPTSFLTYEYHIAYSIAYRTPVLYFTIWTQDGHLLSLDQVWNQFKSTCHQLTEEKKWSTLTQQIHPVLKRPYYQLHPCHTAQLMKVSLTVFDKSNFCFNYLICWLSTVGCIVGLKLSIEYGKLMKPSSNYC